MGEVVGVCDRVVEEDVDGGGRPSAVGKSAKGGMRTVTCQTDGMLIAVRRAVLC